MYFLPGAEDFYFDGGLAAFQLEGGEGVDDRDGGGEDDFGEGRGGDLCTITSLATLHAGFGGCCCGIAKIAEGVLGDFDHLIYKVRVAGFDPNELGEVDVRFCYGLLTFKRDEAADDFYSTGGGGGSCWGNDLELKGKIGEAGGGRDGSIYTRCVAGDAGEEEGGVFFIFSRR